MLVVQEAISVGRRGHVLDRRPTREEGLATSLRLVVVGSKVGLVVCRVGLLFLRVEAVAMPEDVGRLLGQGEVAHLSASTEERLSTTAHPSRGMPCREKRQQSATPPVCLVRKGLC